jgi:hypothetical protein
MSYQPMGQQTQRKNTTKWEASQPAKTPEHDFGRNRRNSLQISSSTSRFPRYGMAVLKVFGYWYLGLNQFNQ